MHLASFPWSRREETCGEIRIPLRDCTSHSQIYDFPLPTLVLNSRTVENLDDIGMFEAPVRFYLPHGNLDSFLARSHEDFLERVPSTRRGVGNEVNERESAFPEQLVNLVRPPVYLECGVPVFVRLCVDSCELRRTVCRCTSSQVSLNTTLVERRTYLRQSQCGISGIKAESIQGNGQRLTVHTDMAGNARQ